MVVASLEHCHIIPNVGSVSFYEENDARHNSEYESNPRKPSGSSLLEVRKNRKTYRACFVSASMLGILHTLYHPNPTIKPGIDLLQTMKLNSRKVKASGKFGSESTSFLDAILPGTSYIIYGFSLSSRAELATQL